MTKAFLIMGVSGCGKSTVGQALADRLDCPFYDGDDFHPPANVAKMSNGVPLNDDDRAPWLARLAALINAHLQKGETAVVACSALKKSYRDQLRSGNEGLLFVHLQGDFDLIWERMKARQNHYMKADMLQSQFDTLEPPEANEALTLDIHQTIDQLVAQILLVAKVPS